MTDQESSRFIEVEVFCGLLPRTQRVLRSFISPPVFCVCRSVFAAICRVAVEAFIHPAALNLSLAESHFHSGTELFDANVWLQLFVSCALW
jgi:hypothetical protein